MKTFLSSDYDELSAINVKENNHLVSDYVIGTILMIIKITVIPP